MQLHIRNGTRPVLIAMFATLMLLTASHAHALDTAKLDQFFDRLAEKVGITIANISVLKNGKAKAIRFSTLEAVCAALDCQPGDILEYKREA